MSPTSARPHGVPALLAAPFLLVVAACAGSGGGEGVGAGGVYDRLPELAVTEAGRFEAGEVVALTVDGEGRIFLAERGGRTVRVLGTGGEAIGEIGAGGGAPVVFSRPEEVAWDGSHLWIFDRIRYQLTRLDGDEVVSQTSFTSFEIAGDPSPYVTVGAVPGGHGLGSAVVLPDIDGGRAQVEHPVVRVAPGGVVLDTLWTQRVGNVEVEIDWFGGGGATAGPQPFSPDPVRAFSWPEGAMVEVSHAVEPQPVLVVRKERLGAAGDGAIREPVFRVEIPFDPAPITPAEIDRALDLFAAGWRGRVETDEEIRALFREALVVPEVRRPYQHVLAAEDGRTWIRLTPPASEGGLGPVPPHTVGIDPEHLGGDATGSRWMILSPEGEPESRALLPAGAVPMWAGEGRVIAVRSLGEERYEVVELRVD